jgi:hypothetical protein
MRIGFAFDLSRIWEHSVKDKRFGIVSAYKKGLSEAENEKRAESMKDYVCKLGYGYKEIYGVWESGDGAITIEYPLFIPNLYRHGAIFLGRDEYLMEGRCSPQEAVIVGDGSEILLINAAEDTVETRWAQTEAGWMEMWEGWSELKGKEWRCSSVQWGMQEMPEAKSWASALSRGAYKSDTSTFAFSREQVKKMYIKR